MSKSLLEVDAQVVEQLANTVRVMTSMIERMIEAQDGHRHSLGNFKEELRRVRDTVARIARVLHEGNGERSVLTRLALAEERLVSACARIVALEERDRLEEEDKRLGRRARYGIIAAVVTGVAGLATSILSLLG